MLLHRSNLKFDDDIGFEPSPITPFDILTPLPAETPAEVLTHIKQENLELEKLSKFKEKLLRLKESNLSAMSKSEPVLEPKHEPNYNFDDKLELFDPLALHKELKEKRLEKKIKYAGLAEQVLSPRSQTFSHRVSPEELYLWYAFFTYFPSQWDFISKNTKHTEATWLYHKGRSLTAPKVAKAIQGKDFNIYGHGAGFRPLEFSDQRTVPLIIIDIDTSSVWHRNIKYIVKCLDDEGVFGARIYRSSNSGGFHIYIPLLEATSASRVKSFFTLFCQKYGIEIKCGQFEVYPTSRNIRYPIQPGFAFLDQETLEVIQECSHFPYYDNLKRFIGEMQESAQITDDDFSMAWVRLRRELQAPQPTVEASESLPEPIVEHQVIVVSTPDDLYEDPDFLPSYDEVSDDPGSGTTSYSGYFNTKGMNRAVYEAGKAFYVHGLNQPSQRHEATKSVCHYLFYGDPSNGLRPLRNDRHSLKNELIHWTSTKHNGWSKEFNSNAQSWADDCETLAFWTNKAKDETKGSEEPRINPYVVHNQKKIDDTKEKIRIHVEYNLGKKINSLSALSDACGVSIPSLLKYREIWEGKLVVGRRVLNKETKDLLKKEQSSNEHTHLYMVLKEHSSKNRDNSLVSVNNFNKSTKNYQSVNFNTS